MKTLSQLGDISGQRVLVRVDFNVPLSNGTITDDARIRAALPTLNYLLEHKARPILVSHLGRPKGAVVAELSLAPVADRLAELIGRAVTLAPGVVGEAVKQTVAQAGPDEIVLLENVRFEAGETANDPELASKLAELADIYVNDAFGAAHRAHASTEGAAKLIKRRAAGLLLQREVETVQQLFNSPPRPLVAVIGGAKVTDKIGVIQRFLEVADHILIGGAMCFPFFKAQGHSVGKSLCETAGIGPAREALAKAAELSCKLHLPTDLVLGREFSASTETMQLAETSVPEGWMGLDIGPKSAAAYAEIVKSAGATFWNGPMGAFELAPFAAGTKAIANAIAQAEGTTVVGGGASLELIEGKKLPGVEVLT